MANQKRRFAVVGGVIILVVIVAAAIIGAGTSKKAMSVSEATQPDAVGERIEVSGTVVDNSYSLEGDVLTFSIYDPQSTDDSTLSVRYDKGVSATFGNGVTTICDGTIGTDGVLECTSLVTKCPSKYETASNALTVSELLGYGDSIVDKTVKVQGVIAEGSLTSAVDGGPRFVLADPTDAADTTSAEDSAAADTLAEPTADEANTASDSSSAGQSSVPVYYSDALPEDVTQGTALVLTGSLDADGSFHATAVAKEA